MSAMFVSYRRRTAPPLPVASRDLGRRDRGAEGLSLGATRLQAGWNRAIGTFEVGSISASIPL